MPSLESPTYFWGSGLQGKCCIGCAFVWEKLISCRSLYWRKEETNLFLLHLVFATGTQLVIRIIYLSATIVLQNFLGPMTHKANPLTIKRESNQFVIEDEYIFWVKLKCFLILINIERATLYPVPWMFNSSYQLILKSS